MHFPRPSTQCKGVRTNPDPSVSFSGVFVGVRFGFWGRRSYVLLGGHCVFVCAKIKRLQQKRMSWTGMRLA